MTTIRTTAAWSLGALVAAAGGGIAAGALTAYLQGELSADWNTIANSGAAWTLVAALVAGLLARQRTTAAAVGLLVLVGEVVGYYAYVTHVEHLGVLRAEEALWTVAAVWIGPVAGVAAFAVRWGSARDRIVALLAFCGLLGGEGTYLAHLAGVPRAGMVEVALAVAGGIVALVAVPASWWWRVGGVLAAGAVAAGVYLAYAQPLIA